MLQRAVAARPGDWASQDELGIFYRSQQRYAEAERAYRRVITLSPDNHVGYRNLGVALINLGRNGKQKRLAAQSVRAASSGHCVQQPRSPPDVREALHRCRSSHGKSGRIGALRNAHELSLWGNLGDAYWLAQQDPQKARVAWLKAAEIVEQQLTGTDWGCGAAESVGEVSCQERSREAAVQRIESALIDAPNSAMFAIKPP